MKKEIEVSKNKLSLAKEKVVILSDEFASGVQGGVEQQAITTKKSTNYDFTCTLCTTLLPPPEDSIEA
ncbi:MAG TPA: class I lanthipeptide [Chitinophaga sp.]|uniref:class I lanthipeptide n=1 Tax=Chitinophaga sp. TaxID=1869181 RepID=UPI002B596248|nr:class I lanthipeptide [Chitinophaga sp.]HVI46010.1 class I lanthipeptide [Chitinophaga sp.]